MIKKKEETLEARLLSPKEIDEQISMLQRQKMQAFTSGIKPRVVSKVYDFSELLVEDVFDYHTFYEVSDLKTNAVYYLNGVQVSALFGMNDECKKQFAQKTTGGQVQVDDKLVSFYYKEVK